VRDHQDGQPVIDDHCAQHAEHLVADLKAGKPIFTGTVKSNTGKLITGKDTGLYDPRSKPPLTSSKESSAPSDSR